MRIASALPFAVKKGLQADFLATSAAGTWCQQRLLHQKIHRFCRWQTVKKPFREVWRAKALQMQSESGDMCGGFGNLAVQGFLAPFPAREPHGGERETA